MTEPRPGLRERQLRLTREAILEACADLVNQRRHLGFTMQEIAKGAGMSMRTLYNHYPTREDLLDALMTHLERRMIEVGGIAAEDIGSLADVPEAVRVNFGVFESLGGISEAVAQMAVAVAHDNARHQLRTERFVEWAGELLADAEPDEARQVGVLIRHLASHRSWYALTRDYGLTTPEAADAVARMIGLIIGRDAT